MDINNISSINAIVNNLNSDNISHISSNSIQNLDTIKTLNNEYIKINKNGDIFIEPSKVNNNLVSGNLNTEYVLTLIESINNKNMKDILKNINVQLNDNSKNIKTEMSEKIAKIKESAEQIQKSQPTLLSKIADFLQAILFVAVAVTAAVLTGGALAGVAVALAVGILVNKCIREGLKESKYLTAEQKGLMDKCTMAIGVAMDLISCIASGKNMYKIPSILSKIGKMITVTKSAQQGVSIGVSKVAQSKSELCKADASKIDTQLEISKLTQSQIRDRLEKTVQSIKDSMKSVSQAMHELDNNSRKMNNLIKA